MSSDSTPGLDKEEHHISYIRLIDIDARKVKTFYFGMTELKDLTGFGLFNSETWIE